VSFAAFHHVSNQQETLREMFRVTAPGGRVVFCEPLSEHSVTTAAQVEMEAYGFLERDIDLQLFERVARNIGFERLVLKPYSQTPDDELTSNSLLRNTMFSAEQVAKRYLDSYSVFYLEKAGSPPLDSAHPGRLRAQIDVDDAVIALPPGGTATLLVHLRNTGDTLWLSCEHPQGGYVTLGCQLLDAEKRRITRDYQRCSLSADVPPGEERSLTIEVTAPADPGNYLIKLDMVNENMCWFEEVGSSAVTFALTVAADNAQHAPTHE